MLIIGITGGTGSGKSTVSEVFRDLGAHWMDADDVYHKLLKESKPLLRELLKRFPEAVENGKLCRKKLAELVFSDSAALSDLNSIAHKYVIEEAERKIAELYEQNALCLCIDAIALFESGLDAMCDVTIGVTAPRSTRIARIMERDKIDSMAASARINAQQSDDFYTARCDYMIANDGDMDTMIEDANNIFETIMKGPENTDE